MAHVGAHSLPAHAATQVVLYVVVFNSYFGICTKSIKLLFFCMVSVLSCHLFIFVVSLDLEDMRFLFSKDNSCRAAPGKVREFAKIRTYNQIG